jgi:hypothetical protein
LALDLLEPKSSRCLRPQHTRPVRQMTRHASFFRTTSGGFPCSPSAPIPKQCLETIVRLPPEKLRENGTDSVSSRASTVHVRSDSTRRGSPDAQNRKTFALCVTNGASLRGAKADIASFRFVKLHRVITLLGALRAMREEPRSNRSPGKRLPTGSAPG